MPTNKRIIELAIKGLEAERERLGQEIAELQKLTGGGAPDGASSTSTAGMDARPRKKRRPMTAAQKRAISATMKAKWAARKKGLA